MSFVLRVSQINFSVTRESMEESRECLALREVLGSLEEAFE